MGNKKSIVIGGLALCCSIFWGYQSYNQFNKYYNHPEEVRIVENMKQDFINKGYSNKQYKKILNGVKEACGGSIGKGVIMGLISLGFLGGGALVTMVEDISAKQEDEEKGELENNVD
jgi:hypothetical protein